MFSKPSLDRAGQLDLPIIPRLGQVGIPVSGDQPGALPVGELTEEAERSRTGAGRYVDRGKTERATLA
eukprot:10016773-Alexandrium_andersonii.AAC.1